MKVFSFSRKHWLIFFSTILFSLVSFYSFANVVSSGSPLNDTINKPLEEVQEKTDFQAINQGEAPEKVENLIGIILNFILGATLTFFIVSVFTAGFIWMTSEGNEEKTKKAKTLIFQSSVGMGIVFFAYLIAYVIIAVLSYRTGFQVP